MFLEGALGAYAGPVVDVDRTVVDLDVERERDRLDEWLEYLRRFGDEPRDRMLARSQIQKAEQRLMQLEASPPNQSEIVNVTTRVGWDGCGTASARYTIHRWRSPVTSPTS